MDSQTRMLCLYLLHSQCKKRRNRVNWVHPLNVQRPIAGAFVLLFSNLRSHESKFFNYFRMSVASFDELLDKVQGKLMRQNTNMRDAVPAVERLAVTLRYLATGNSFADLHYSYRLGKSTISGIVNEVCDALWNTLLSECMPSLTTEHLEQVAHDFERKTQFPHCIGAVDGKHVRVIKPENSGSLFFNYKEYFSIILLAVADSEYRLLFVDIGAYGKDCDSTVFKATTLWKNIENSSLPLPAPRPLCSSMPEAVQYVLIGDEGFGIHKNLMRPFAGTPNSIGKRVFNYRLCRARRYVECTFGILSNKWRILHRPLNVKEELAIKIVRACCILHNFVRVRDGYNFEDSLTISGLQDVQPAPTGRGKKEGEEIRKVFVRYFMSDKGCVQWQNKMV